MTPKVDLWNMLLLETWTVRSGLSLTRGSCTPRLA
jgi:hypothetical protein